MGEYFKILNADRKEYIDPFCMPECSEKFPSLIFSKYIGAGITALLCYTEIKMNGYYTQKLIGSWNNNDIRIIGDYQHEDLCYQLSHNLEYKNISYEVLAMLCELDNVVAEELAVLSYKDNINLFNITGPVALLEKNILQFELDKKFGNRQKWIDLYYRIQTKQA